MPAPKTEASSTPQSVADVIMTITRNHEQGPDTQVFLLHRAGKGTEIVAAGADYETMWDNASARFKQPKGELLKTGLMFDVMSAAEAEGEITRVNLPISQADRVVSAPEPR